MNEKYYDVSIIVGDDSKGKTYCDVRITTEDEKLAKIIKEKFASGQKELIKEFVNLLDPKF